MRDAGLCLAFCYENIAICLALSIRMHSVRLGILNHFSRTGIHKRIILAAMHASREMQARSMVKEGGLA